MTDLSDGSVKQSYISALIIMFSVGVPMETAKAAINNGFKARDWTLDSGSLRFVSTVVELPSLVFGEQGWRSGESARLPPMCPGFDSRTRRHMWAEFVGSLLCSERFFSGNSGFPLHKNQHLI